MGRVGWNTHKNKPENQLAVGEKVKCASRTSGFDKRGHVDPALHPVFAWACQGVEEEHEEDAGIDAYVEVSDCTNGIDLLVVSSLASPLPDSLFRGTRLTYVQLLQHMDMCCGGKV